MDTPVRSDSTNSCVMEVSPGGTKYWVPTCDEGFTPYMGQRFDSFAHAITFYRRYGSVVGFDVRWSTRRKNREGAVSLNHLVCSREGFKKVVVDSSSAGADSNGGTLTQKRRRVSNRVGCNARMVLKLVWGGCYVVHSIELRHNHCLCSDVAKPFLCVNRQLNFGHQTFILNCARANIGPSRSFRLYKGFAGSYDNIGATSVNFKNLKRDLMAYIGSGDAHMVVSRYVKKVECCSDYFFAHDLDSADQLRRVFWADPLARRNYEAFGDVVSFDATYGTNRYNMVFVPFTGVDNHKKCVTFAIGLIAKEDVESYVWLLENFKRALGRVPSCTVTDQDPSMRIAVARVFEGTRHRFCMWHIMSKVGEKVGTGLANDEGFRTALNAVVWNESLTVVEFETRWQVVMEKYDLVNHRWLQNMYDLRSFWIPAFFNDVFMGGLLRTTSRSEAENSVFGSCTNQHASLLEFFNNFEGAIDAQRHAQGKLNADCEAHFPNRKTPLLIERHASEVYTINVFYDVQAQIFAGCFSCRVITLGVEGEVWRYEIQDADGSVFSVQFDGSGDIVACTCKMFERIGLFCRHIFLVFKDRRLESIPMRYVLSRWTRGACVRPMLEVGSGPDGVLQAAVREAMTEFYSFMGLASKNVEDVVAVTTAIKELKAGIVGEDGFVPQYNARREIFEAFCGSSVSDEFTIRPPALSKNKGSGKRLKSSREVAVAKAARPNRVCRTCKQLGHHDSRNCPSAQLD